jgi:hypothetical protein
MPLPVEFSCRIWDQSDPSEMAAIRRSENRTILGWAGILSMCWRLFLASVVTLVALLRKRGIILVVAKVGHLSHRTFFFPYSGAEDISAMLVGNTPEMNLISVPAAPFNSSRF